MPTIDRFHSFASIGLAVVLSIPAAGAWAMGETAADAMSRIPPDVEMALIVPDLAAANRRLEECLARMNRPETAMIGRPMDQLQAYLELPAGFDESGSIVAWVPAPAAAPAPASAPAAAADAVAPDASAGTPPTIMALVPLQDGVDPIGPLLDIGGAKPVAGHDGLVVVTRGEREFFIRREPVDARGGKHLVWGTDAALVESYVIPPVPLALPSAGPAGARRAKHVQDSEVIFVTATPASAPSAVESRLPGDLDASARQAALALASLGDGIQGAVTCVDIDPMGVVLRWSMMATPGSPLAALLQGGERTASALDRLPQAAPYIALSIDVTGLGGAPALKRVLGLVDPGAQFTPPWLMQEAERVKWVQAAAYPSKLGVLAGGVLNDSSLVVGCTEPLQMLEAMRANVASMAGIRGAMRVESTWEAESEVKDVGTAAAFTVKEVPLGPSELQDAADADDSSSTEQVAADAMMQMGKRVIFGSKGMTGFAAATPDALVVTFSRRPDVFRRATDAARGNGESLADESVIRALARMAALDADLTGVIGIGQLSRVVRQVAGAFGGAGNGGPLDRISTRTEPVYVAAEVGGGGVEAVAVVPASVLALSLDAITTAPGAALPPEGLGVDAPAPGVGGGQGTTKE